MDNKKNIWVRRLDFSLLSAWLILGITLAVIAYLFYGEDFRGYYAATRVFLDGGNPYDYHLVSRVLLQVTGEMGNNPYYYPPWFVWMFIPIVFLPFQTARIIWLAFNFVIWNIGLWQLGRTFAWPQTGWRRYSLFALATFSFAWITWRYEQAAILVFVMCVALIRSMEKQNRTWSGIWMALLLIKPNITLIVVAGIGLWMIRNRQWKPVIVMLVALAGLLVVSTWITPDWYAPILKGGFGRGLTDVLDGPDRVVAIRINTTLLDWFRTIGIQPALRIPLYGIAALTGVIVFVWAIFRSRSFLELISILLLISFALTPYALQYDFPPLVIVLFWGLSKSASASRRALWVGLGLAGFVFSVIFWQQNISWAYWMVLGLVLLTGWGIYQDSKQSRMALKDSPT